MKRIGTLLGLGLFMFTLVGCGITEELEQTKSELTDIQEMLVEQKEQYKQINQAISTLTDDFNFDFKESHGKSLDPNGSSKTFTNIEDRKKLMADIEDKNKALTKKKKALSTLIDKNGVDVDQSQVKTIINSLDILNSNFDSLKSYTETTFKQEEEFYSHLPKKMEDQLSLITRSYGAIDLIAEEAQANIDYTNKLIKDFLATAAKNPPRQHAK